MRGVGEPNPSKRDTQNRESRPLKRRLYRYLQKEMGGFLLIPGWDINDNTVQKYDP